MSDPLTVITWQAKNTGLHIWIDGKLVAVISVRQFPSLILDLAKVLRDR